MASIIKMNVVLLSFCCIIICVHSIVSSVNPEVLTMVVVKNSIFWGVTLQSMISYLVTLIN
jgi:hypothetical protein